MPWARTGNAKIGYLLRWTADTFQLMNLNTSKKSLTTSAGCLQSFIKIGKRKKPHIKDD